MKKTLLAIIPAAFLVSCSNSEPAAPAAAPDPYGDPYGVPGGNPPNYDPNSAAYQPIAPINPQSALPGAAPVLPGTAAPVVTPVAPVAAASSHVVVKGDSLWGLSKKYNVTVEALQAANGLTNTQINVGQALAIPAR